MLGYRHKTSQDSKQALAVTLGVLLGVVILLAGTAFMAEKVSSSGNYSVVKLGIPVTCFLAGLLGSLIASWTGKGNAIKTAVIIAGMLTVCNFSVAIFGFDGIQSKIWKSVASIYGGALCCGWIGTKGRKKTRYKK